MPRTSAGSARANQRLYPKLVKAVARVLETGGRALLVTMDSKLMERCLRPLVDHDYNQNHDHRNNHNNKRGDNHRDDNDNNNNNNNNNNRETTAQQRPPLLRIEYVQELRIGYRVKLYVLRRTDAALPPLHSK